MRNRLEAISKPVSVTSCRGPLIVELLGDRMSPIRNEFSKSPLSVFAMVVVALGTVLGVLAERGLSAEGPVKVFVLAGQSNMQGDGRIGPVETPGTLEYQVKSSPDSDRYQHLVNGDGTWCTRKDVWFYQRTGKKTGTGVAQKVEFTDVAKSLTVGLAGTADKPKIGPELQFGHVVGEHFDSQVLVIKTAWGGKSLACDFRPPSAGELPVDSSSKLGNSIADGSVEVGFYYRQMLADVKQVLDNLEQYFPNYEGQGYEIVGFGWHQGWNDGCDAAFSDEYGANLQHFITDIRRDFGVKDLPIVVASSGFGGHDEKLPGVRARIKKVVEPAQIAVSARTKNVTCVETRDFFQPREASPTGASYHWNSNAGTYFMIGDSMGKAMLQLLNQ